MAPTRLVIWEPFRSIFYAPQWVTIHGGHFAAEGLEVEVKTAGGGVTTTGVLLDGGARIALGGIMRSLDVADRGGPFLPHFAEVNSRNGFFLLGRRAHFSWPDLIGKTVLSFAEAPTPWQCMLTVLRRHGVDPAAVRIERTRPAGEAVAAFRAGQGDFLETGQPFTEALLADGAAHLAASMGEATGPLPFSSYMTTTAFLRDGRETLVRFTRALARAQRWMARASAEQISTVIAPAFPDVDPELRRRAVARYQAQGTWPAGPVLGRPGYEYLQQILLDGGFIRGRHRYEDLVDETVARHVVDTLGR
ncbi:MAG TPA: ABC transporter substrate-binding protein [Candidatus Binatia bacterium]|nr:ABC transporter substrate-binding protein [Candidatus Binatia bacterium]